jgi:hypothetical protein
LKETLLRISVVLWVATFAVGSVDGLYYHLIKLRLHERSESKTEHLAHSLRALLLPPTLWVAFAAAGMAPLARLGVLIALIAADWLVAMWDVILESKSRRGLGGLPHAEYFVHVSATATHSAAEAFVIASLVLATRGDEWSAPAMVTGLAWILIAGSALVGVVHVVALTRRKH